MNSQSIGQPWTESQVPDLTGRTAVITGANSGIGFETARILAAHGAAVVLACRTPSKAADARERIRATVPDAVVRIVELDLSSLRSVRGAAARLRTDYDRIDLLVNNAGAAFPARSHTEDGFETTFGTNHLGPFAFTNLLVDRLAQVPGARIVTVSSLAHRQSRIDFSDPQYERRPYRQMGAYGQSKLANLLFTLELQRRLIAAGSGTLAVAAHPGGAATSFGDNMHVPRFMRTRLWEWATSSWMHHEAAAGALPSVRAAVDPHVRAGEYYGPAGPFGLTGPPVLVAPAARALDEAVQARLWRISEQLTGVACPLGATPAELPGR